MRTTFRLSVLCCVLGALSAAACSDRLNPVEPAPASPRDPAAPVSHQTPAGPPADDVSMPDIAAVRRATAKFHDPAVAAAAGYLFTEPCLSTEAGAVGIHAPNPALVRDGVINAETPEVLLYMPRADGTLRLVAVEYFQNVTVRNPVTGVSAPWRGTAPWPSNFQVITPTPQLFGQTFAGPMPGHTATMPWHWDLHVWAWAHNPEGMFAEYNPRLECGG